MNDNERLLLAGLRSLAASETSMPSPSIEAALLQRLRPRKASAWGLVLEAVAALLIIGIALFARHDVSKARANPFVSVPFVQPIGPNERAEVVRVNVSISALAQWGYPVAAINPDQRVNAEVVLGEDGLARAVRLITTN